MKLKDIRLKKGYSRAKLSFYSGVAPKTIYNIECGITPWEQVKLETYILLARTLQVKVVDIVPEIK